MVQARQQQPDGLRVVTATAQGVQHWSQHLEQVKVLFEVYGECLKTRVSGFAAYFQSHSTLHLLHQY